MNSSRKSGHIKSIALAALICDPEFHLVEVDHREAKPPAVLLQLGLQGGQGGDDQGHRTCKIKIHQDFVNRYVTHSAVSPKLVHKTLNYPCELTSLPLFNIVSPGGRKGTIPNRATDLPHPETIVLF